MGKTKVGIVFGGRSSEHEVSLLSAASVSRAIDREKYDVIYVGITKTGEFRLFKGTIEEMEKNTWVEKSEPISVADLSGLIDFALPIVHGQYCEDGKLQGLFEMLDIPYGGCGVLASALAMDKLAAKDVFVKHGIPVCGYTAVHALDYENEPEEVRRKVEKEIGYPMFVKPANMGSSVGISKAHDRTELDESIKLALEYDKRLIIETFVDAREIEVAVVGNGKPVPQACGEIMAKGAEFYDYGTKYTDGAAELSIPADIPKEMADKLREYAAKAYSALDCEGFARCDFLVEKKTGQIYLNEINTIPGFTKYSMFPLLCKAAGMEYKETIETIIKLGYERYNAENNRKTVF